VTEHGHMFVGWAALALMVASAATAQQAIPTSLQTEYQPLGVSVVAANLEHPWAMAFLPGGNLLVTERPGRLRRVSEGAVLEVTGLPGVHAQGQGGLLDVALHPRFDATGWVYLAYSRGDAEQTVLAVGRGGLEQNRLTGFEEIFVTNRGASPGGHYGGRLLFLPDGTLLVSVGDRGDPSRAQDPSDHAGSILRIDEDGGIPADNPFIGDPRFASEVYTYGHRNVQGLALDPASNRVWATEHGPRGGDELNLLEPGGNFGWPVVSLGRNYPNQVAAGTTRTAPGMIDPVIEFQPTLAPSGLAFVQGGVYHRAWNGNLLAGGLRSERILRIVLEGAEVVHMEEIVNGQLGRIRDVRVGPDGSTYVATDSSDGAVYRIAPPPRDDSSILARVEAAAELGTWLELIEHAGLSQPFETQGPFTMFAPTEAAFAALPADFLNELKQDPQRLLPLLALHVAPGVIPLTELGRERETVTSVSGVAIPLSLDNLQVRLQDSLVLRGDIQASNGVIHVIDRVLLPPAGGTP